MKSRESQALLTPAARAEAQAPVGQAGRTPIPIPIPMHIGIGIAADTMAILYARPGGRSTAIRPVSGAGSGAGFCRHLSAFGFLAIWEVC